jgi:hypothetical protein
VKHDYFTPDLTTQAVNTALNDLIERTSAAKAELPRPYLGASIAGSDCMRRVQFDWWCVPMHSARIREIGRTRFPNRCCGMVSPPEDRRRHLRARRGKSRKHEPKVRHPCPHGWVRERCSRRIRVRSRR